MKTDTVSFVISQRGETCRFTLTHDDGGWWCHGGIGFKEHPDDDHWFPNPEGWEGLVWNNGVGYHHKRFEKCLRNVMRAVERITEDRRRLRQARGDEKAMTDALEGSGER